MQTDKNVQNIILNRLGSKYRKTLLIDFTDGSFKVGNLANDEMTALQNTDIKTISEYWQWFCKSDFIHDECRDACLAFKLQPDCELIYKRRIGTDYHWMLMEIKPLDTNPNMSTLFVRDINETYEREYNAVVEKLGTTDSKTGLLNHLAFERDKDKHKNETIGIVFADVNGLKYANDTQGHAAGDKLIITLANLLSVNFSDYRCYHIHGDEFIVCCFGKPLREFLTKAVAFHKSMWIGMDHPIASVGYSIGEAGEFQQAYDEAEKEMYDDKRIFYSKFPNFKAR